MEFFAAGQFYLHQCRQQDTLRLGHGRGRQRLGLQERVHDHYTRGQCFSGYDRLGWKDREWSKVLSLASYDLLYYFLEAQIRAKQQVIVEANFKASIDSPKMMRLIAEYQYHAIQFYCYSEERVLLERFQIRANTPERHPGHVDHLNLDDLRTSLELAEYQPLALHSSVCEVDTTDFLHVDYGKLTQDLRELLHHL